MPQSRQLAANMPARRSAAKGGLPALLGILYLMDEDEQNSFRTNAKTYL
jgi:hypothetical protein